MTVGQDELFSVVSGQIGGAASSAVRAAPYEATLLETALPIRELSLLAGADRRSTDPVYGAHRWWARRPTAIMRGILLAASLSSHSSSDDFWTVFASPAPALAGLRVLDPFVGGGSTLVEAARLGADVTGGDIDPLAVEIVRHELTPASEDEVRQAGDNLLSFLTQRYGDLYPADGSGAVPLHYFWLHEVACPSCRGTGLLYRNLTLVRDAQKLGAVVRDNAITAFCPEDLTVHELDDLTQQEFSHASKSWKITEASFTNGRYTCTHCGRKSTHRELKTGVAPRRLVAVEVTAAGKKRRLRAASTEDYQAFDRAREYLAEDRSLQLPAGKLAVNRHDDRPISYGIESAKQLFNERQQVVLGAAMNWIENADLSQPVRRAITLAISNALATNNKLCSYATDYGRLSALFSVRGFPLPALPVELNPLHPHGGRGTFRQCIDRVAKSATETVQRYVWSPAKGAPVRIQLQFPRSTIDEKEVAVTSAADQNGGTTADLCIFDPPYFDYIPYSELSEFYRAWRSEPTAASQSPLHPRGENPASQFGLDFADCIRATLRRLSPGRPIAFTYHSANPDAWQAIGVALDDAKMAITGIWPVRSDGHMGHHSNPGNCEWDLIVCCRRVAETEPAEFTTSVQDWVDAVQPLSVSESDKINMNLARSMAICRFAAVASPGGTDSDTGRAF